MDKQDKTSILVLDDEQIVLKRLQPALERSGYKVETFSRSADAFDRVDEKTFDIVITDLKMEGSDGMAFLTHVKKIAPETEVIVITGFATMDTAKESFKKGVFDFLAKPFKLGELIEAVKKAEKRINDSTAD